MPRKTLEIEIFEYLHDSSIKCTDFYSEVYNLKMISVSLYMTLRHFDITWRDFDQFCTDNHGGKLVDKYN